MFSLKFRNGAEILALSFASASASSGVVLAELSLAMISPSDGAVLAGGEVYGFGVWRIDLGGHCWDGLYCRTLAEARKKFAEILSQD